MIYIVSKKRKLDNIIKEYPTAIICDITSKSPNSLVRLSPFFPHGGIPVPFSPGLFSQSVEGVWQGLKVFENADVSLDVLEIASMSGIKRTCKKYGRVIGHRKGYYSNEIINYVSAKHEIYIPTYIWMLENKSLDIVQRMAKSANEHDIVLLDYNTCEDFDSPSQPLSHAAILKKYITEHFHI